MMPPPRMLRVAVTDRCNLRCSYCMPEDRSAVVGSGPGNPRNHLALEELAKTVEWLHERWSLSKIKITGGEPLMRPGLPAFVVLISQLRGNPELSMTTNGALLSDRAAALKSAGLQRVNISLDTLDSENYAKLTRGGDVEAVLEGIEAAKLCDLGPIKINSVLRRTTWRADVPQLLDFCADRGHVLRFLELMHTGTERSWSTREAVEAHVVREWLSRSGDYEELRTVHDDGQGSSPARIKRVIWKGRKIDVGWILPRSRPFCVACDRLRLDAQGRVRRCLMDSSLFDLAERRKRQDESRVERELRAFLAGKRAPRSMDNALPMAQLGG